MRTINERLVAASRRRATLLMQRTHCYNGHEFTDANTRRTVTKAGRPSRVCLACEKARTARRMAGQR